MVNFIGGLPDRHGVLSIPNVHLHFYGKTPRKGRKVAHATVLAATESGLSASLKPLNELAEQADDS
jgi:5-(carboxyamino)imidazole ribonucleotide synthase